jgi:6-phosphogluconolactonase
MTDQPNPLPMTFSPPGAAIVSLVAGASAVSSAGTVSSPVAERGEQHEVRGEPQTAGRSSERLRVYVGTYTSRGGKGIYLFDLDLATGKPGRVSLAGEATNPSFLAIHPNGRFLYSVTEVDSAEGRDTGAVGAFAIDARTGTLAALNQESSGGRGPCHLSVDGAGKCVLVANYGGGSVAALPIRPDGRVAPASTVVRHEGKSVDPGRQDKPYAHSINLDPSGRFAFAADLGADKIFVYRFDAERGTLAANDPPAASVAPGAGPRHFAFHPNGRAAYVINEMGNTVTAFRYDPEKGALAETQTLSTLPAGFTGKTWTAEVVVHPSGKFLYGSNRGHDSIAIFAIDGAGKLTVVGHEPTQGKTPRNFAVDPSGTFLLAANQDSNSVVVFRIDPQSGRLAPTGHQVEAPMPVCIRMMPAP